MPVLDSFTVDHTKMKAPAVRIAKIMKTPNQDTITVFDLRFCIPNEEMLPERGLHTLEHLFAGLMRHYINSSDIEVIDISPMGCRTGFYMSVIGSPDEGQVITAWRLSMVQILKVENESAIPELNEYQCGSFKMHSLDEAKMISLNVLKRGVDINSNSKLDIADILDGIRFSSYMK